MNQRPELKHRKYLSPSVDSFIAEVVEFMVDKELAKIFENSFPNTLDTTVNYSISNN